MRNKLVRLEKQKKGSVRGGRPEAGRRSPGVGREGDERPGGPVHRRVPAGSAGDHRGAAPLGGDGDQQPRSAEAAPSVGRDPRCHLWGPSLHGVLGGLLPHEAGGHDRGGRGQLRTGTSVRSERPGRRWGLVAYGRPSPCPPIASLGGLRVNGGRLVGRGGRRQFRTPWPGNSDPPTPLAPRFDGNRGSRWGCGVSGAHDHVPRDGNCRGLVTDDHAIFAWRGDERRCP